MRDLATKHVSVQVEAMVEANPLLAVVGFGVGKLLVIVRVSVRKVIGCG